MGSGPAMHISAGHEATLPSSFLVHYYEKDLLLAADESPYRVGAVLSYLVEDRSEKPIA